MRLVADVNVSRAAFLHCHKLRAVHENWRAIESQTSTDGRGRGREPDIRARVRNATPRTEISGTTNPQQLARSSSPCAISVICRATAANCLWNHIPELAECHFSYILAICSSKTDKLTTAGNIAYLVAAINDRLSCVSIHVEADAWA